MSGLRRIINRLLRGDKPTANSRWVTTRGTSVWDEAAGRYVEGESEGYWHDGSWALAHTVNPVWVTGGWRFRKDDGSESTATWYQAEDTNVPKTDGIKAGDPFRFRIAAGESAKATQNNTGSWTLQFNNDDSPGWITVGLSQDVSWYNSANLTNGTPILTSRLTAAAGTTFTSGFGDTCEDGVSISNTYDNRQGAEVEYALELGANVLEDAVITFRLLDPEGNPITLTGVPQLIAAVPPVPNLNQNAYRFVDDDGNESGSTLLGTINTAYTGDRGTIYRCRIQINNSATSGADTYKPQYRVNGGAWGDLLDTGTDVKSSLSTQYTDNTATTERLAGAGTFTAGEIIEGASPVTGSITIGNGEDTEIEFAFETVDLLSGEYVEFRLVGVTDGVLDTYSQTPRFDVASTAVQTVLRTSFATPTSDLMTGTDKQKFRLWVRRDSKNTGTGTPTVDLFLYESGTQKQALATGISVTSDSGQLIEDSWDATNLTAVSGVNVELRAVGQVGGTGLNARTVEFGAVEWCVEHSAGAAIDIAAALLTTLAVAADLDSQGKLTSGQSIALSVAADLDAQGKLEAAASIVLALAADLDAAGEFSATTSLVLALAADLGALGELAAAQSLTLSLAADLDAPGRIEAATALALSITANIEAPSVPGELAANIGTLLVLAADLKASGNLAAATTLTLAVAADLDAAGELSSTQSLLLSLAADVDAPGTVEATIALAVSLAADLDADGSIEMTTALALALAADLDATGQLSSAQSLALSVAADLDAAGNLAAALSLTLSIASDVTPGDPKDIAAALTLALTLAADLDGAGTLALAPSIVTALAADLSAPGSMAVTQALVLALAASLSAAGEIQAATTLQLAVLADLDAQGELSATVATALAVAADLDARGKVEAATSIVLAITAGITDLGGSDITAATTIALAASFDIDAPGALADAITVALAAAADVDAPGALAATLALALALTADLDAQGSLTATETLALTVAASLNAQGKLEASTALVLALAADITPADNKDLVAAIAEALVVAADVDAPGTLAAAPAVALAVASNLNAPGTLAAAPALTISAAADLIGQGRLDAANTLLLQLSADLDAAGLLAVSTTQAITVAASLTAQGKIEQSLIVALSFAAAIVDGASADLTASPTISLTAVPSLNATGKLESALSLVMSLAAEVQDASAVVSVEVPGGSSDPSRAEQLSARMEQERANPMLRQKILREDEEILSVIVAITENLDL